jgi:hypothetical protein
MPPRRKRNPAGDAIVLALPLFLKLPLAWRVAVVGLAVVAAVIYFTARPHPTAPPTADPDLSSASNAGLAVSPVLAPDGSGRYLFCFWNMENLFDDVNDNRRPTDEEYDDPFAADAPLRRLKYDHLASALIGLNDGRGPDVIAGVELENPRAAELLRATLNAKIADPKWRYVNVEMKDLDAGRHIAPALLTRLPVDSAKTRLRGSKTRILETRLRVNGYDLCVVVSHWTSQVTQRGGGGDTDSGRGKYASIIRDLLAEKVEADPAADFLVCGDFNDAPDSDAVVQVLHATADRPAPGQPLLFNLMAGKPADRFGTLWYGSKPLIYDQICVSAGMLDRAGWGCEVDSVRAVTDGLIRPGSTRRQPWRFGNPQPAVADAQRGFSDHFPVTVELTVAPPLRP